MSVDHRRILVVDDDPENVRLITELLGKEGYHVAQAADGESALHRVAAWKPQVALVDVNMPGMSGLELVPRIHSAAGADSVSVVLCSANVSREDIEKGLDSGADDYLAKPFRMQELLTRMHTALRIKDLRDSLRRAQNRVDELASRDPLTGLVAFSSWVKKAEEEILRCSRSKRPLTLIAVNLDGFSKINSEHGLFFGNHVLRETGRVISTCLRSVDIPCRLGGDEFLILLIEMDLAGGEFLAERIREAVAGTQFTGQGQKQGKLTACLGVSGYRPGAHPTERESLEALVGEAVEALRAAKGTGPNRTEIYSFA